MGRRYVRLEDTWNRNLLRSGQTGLEGFEPPTSGLEARRSILTKPQTHVVVLYIGCLVILTL